jgi:predicted N-acetyltransferase YhbS
MRNLVVRESTASDDAAVGELLVEAFRHQFAKKLPDVVYSPQRLADLRNQSEKRTHATVLVAEIAGRIVGTVAVYPPGAPGSKAWIANASDLRLLAIDPEFQGQGLSNQLLDTAEERARNWGVAAICLHTRRGATGVAMLYNRRGYVRDESGDIDLRPDVYLEGHLLRF